MGIADILHTLLGVGVLLAVEEHSWNNLLALTRLLPVPTRYQPLLE